MLHTVPIAVMDVSVVLREVQVVGAADDDIEKRRMSDSQNYGNANLDDLTHLVVEFHRNLDLTSTQKLFLYDQQ